MYVCTVCVQILHCAHTYVFNLLCHKSMYVQYHVPRATLLICCVLVAYRSFMHSPLHVILYLPYCRLMLQEYPLTDQMHHPACFSSVVHQVVLHISEGQTQGVGVRIDSVVLCTNLHCS